MQLREPPRGRPRDHFFHNFSMYEPQVQDRNANTTNNWRRRVREISKQCAFGIQVGCDATIAWKQLLEEGNDAPPQTTAQADGQSLLLGPDRPNEPFALIQPTRVCGPDRDYGRRPDRAWRCTLAGPAGGKSNMCAVLDTRCAEREPHEGHGLKDPTCDEHKEILHERGETSRLSHFTVHLQNNIGHIGKQLRILVGHFNPDSARKTYKNAEKRKYYKEAERMIHTFKTHLYCADADMSLLETQDCIAKAWEDARRPTTKPRMSVAAWFPYHFENPEGEPDKFKTIPFEGLGVDSMGMFFITHGEEDTAQAAQVLPIINHKWVNALLKPEEHRSWALEYKTEQADKKRYFTTFGPKSGYPGQHSAKFQRYPDQRLKSLKDQLIGFLDPHTDEQTLDELAACRMKEYMSEKKKSDEHKTSGEEHNVILNNTPFPNNCTPYPTITEIRIDMREWTQENNCVQRGTHIPLCIQFGGMSRRSRKQQQKHERGTHEYNATQSRKNAPNSHGHPSQQTVPPVFIPGTDELWVGQRPTPHQRMAQHVAYGVNADEYWSRIPIVNQCCYREGSPMPHPTLHLHSGGAIFLPF